MKNLVTICIAGFTAVTISLLGIMLYQAMNVEAAASAGIRPATTQFTCSIVEDFTGKGEVKSCCWDGRCARFPVRPY